MNWYKLAKDIEHSKFIERLHEHKDEFVSWFNELHEDEELPEGFAFEPEPNGQWSVLGPDGHKIVSKEPSQHDAWKLALVRLQFYFSWLIDEGDDQSSD